MQRVRALLPRGEKHDRENCNEDWHGPDRGRLTPHRHPSTSLRTLDHAGQKAVPQWNGQPLAQSPRPESGDQDFGLSSFRNRIVGSEDQEYDTADADNAQGRASGAANSTCQSRAHPSGAEIEKTRSRNVNAERKLTGAAGNQSGWMKALLTTVNTPQPPASVRTIRRSWLRGVLVVVNVVFQRYRIWRTDTIVRRLL